MIRKILFISLVLAVFSCSAPDKQAKLESLKAEHDKIAQQIQELEKELGATGVNDPSANAADVAITELKPTEFKHFIEIQGKVDAEENTQVSAQTPGVVVSIYVREGSSVKKGQVLAELDTQVLKKSLDEVNTQLVLANDLYDKQKNLWDKRIGTEVQYLTAKANKESLEQRYATLQEQMEMAKFKSPINGTVENIPFKVGQIVSPGVPGSAIRVINMSKVKVVAEVAEAYSANIKTGNDVIVLFPDFGKEVASKVTFTSRYIDPTNRTFTVESKLESSPFEYRANMIAKLRINDYTNPQALVVPVNLVQNSMEGYYVSVAEKNSDYTVAKRRLIKTGIVYNGLMEITEGLQPGDKVITTGYMNLKEGERIKF
jgi:membrane fusion protein, multidrug efflux system